MREKGFEPSQALSYCGLSAARLTTPALPHEKGKFLPVKKIRFCPTTNSPANSQSRTGYL
tara:strand:+ start:151 stop:330 length:180 start_codon:yes stop_codon:yes gene_type:complete